MEEQPLTIPTFREILRDELNDRFHHYEKRVDSRMAALEEREDARHREIMHGFAGVAEQINDHMDERLDGLQREIRTIAIGHAALARTTGHPELATG